MQMGAQTESVTVTADVAAIDTDRSVVNQLMDNKAVSELPLNGRQVFMLMQLSAGTVFTQQQFGASGFSGTRAWDTNGSLTMHGGTTSSNQFNLDGASINAGTGEWKFAPAGGRHRGVQSQHAVLRRLARPFRRRRRQYDDEGRHQHPARHALRIRPQQHLRRGGHADQPVADQGHAAPVERFFRPGQRPHQEEQAVLLELV